MDNLITLETVMREWLTERGYDGLCNVECGCGLHDFMPCGDPEIDCQPAYKDTPSAAEQSLYDYPDEMYRPGKRPGAEESK